MEQQRVLRSAASRRRVAPYEVPAPVQDNRRAVAAGQSSQQEQQALLAAATAEQEAALRAEAAALAEAPLDEYFATYREKPGPVTYVQPPSTQTQFAALSESLRTEVAATLANGLAQLTSTVESSLVRAVAPLEVPTGLSSGAAAAAAQTMEAIAEQLKDKDNGK